MSASWRVPYWWVFVGTFDVLFIGFVTLSIWSGAPVAVVVWLVFGAFTFDRFEYRTLYRLELEDDVLVCRSAVKRWRIPLSEVKSVIPGWRQPWWKKNGNVYVLSKNTGRPLYIWCGKGLFDFLTAIGSVEPDLMPRPEDGQSRVERSRGKSGFIVHRMG